MIKISFVLHVPLLQNEFDDEAEVKDGDSNEQENDVVVDETFLNSLQHPLYTSQHERINRESQVYFRPSSIPGKSEQAHSSYFLRQSVCLHCVHHNYIFKSVHSVFLH